MSDMFIAEFNSEAITIMGPAKREWLVTNGIGGYAMGTVAGVLARHYHALLIAALNPPLGRQVLVSGFEERVNTGDKIIDLYTHQYGEREITPTGYLHLETFSLHDGTPQWHYALGESVLEKQIWMEHGKNTAYVAYRLFGPGPLTLSIAPLLNDRDHHESTEPGSLQLEVLHAHERLDIRSEKHHWFIHLPEGSEFSAGPFWREGLYKAIEAYRGEPEIEACYCPGRISLTLLPDTTVLFVLSTEIDVDRDFESAYSRHLERQQALLWQAGAKDKAQTFQQLVLAADQFIVARPSENDPQGSSIIAGYPWFSDWGRDTMIALPGLTLTTGRIQIAESILRTYAHYVHQGMIPNRFPDEGEQPEYNTVDATLWYFETLRASYEITKNVSLLKELFPVMKDIIRWHIQGTRYQIRVDSADGLLYAGQADVQLTWMDVKIDDWVVTPRTGKAVEINALWYNALRCMAFFATELGQSADEFVQMAATIRQNFQRFWNEQSGCCFDVIDTLESKNDTTLRPNQLLAISLHYCDDLLTLNQQKSIVDICQRELLTSRGLRSLNPGHPDYHGHYGGDRHTRDSAYHQGIVWGWLIGPFISAHLRAYSDPLASRTLFEPILTNLSEHGLGTLSEIFDGDSPHTARGCIAQAWSVGEALRICAMLYDN